MQVPSGWLDGYTGAVTSVTQRAQIELRAALDLVDYTQPMVDLRRELIGLMEDYCDAAAQVGVRLSADFYNELRYRVTGERLPSVSLRTLRSKEDTRKAVLALLRELEEGELEGVEDLQTELVNHMDVEVKRAVARNTIENVRNDPGDVRYARVPQGETTCDFCIMLASRGPVYWSEESAGAFTKFHEHCDCKVVPFFGTEEDGASRRKSGMSVEGYDPDALYEQYRATQQRKREWHAKHDKRKQFIK